MSSRSFQPRASGSGLRRSTAPPVSSVAAGPLAGGAARARCAEELFTHCFPSPRTENTVYLDIRPKSTLEIGCSRSLGVSPQIPSHTLGRKLARFAVLPHTGRTCLGRCHAQSTHMSDYRPSRTACYCNTARSALYSGTGSHPLQAMYLLHRYREQK